MSYLTASLKSSKIPNHSHPVPFIFVSYCLIVCFKHLWMFTNTELNNNCQGPIWCPSRGPCAMAQWHIGQSEPASSFARSSKIQTLENVKLPVHLDMSCASSELRHSNIPVKENKLWHLFYKFNATHPTIYIHAYIRMSVKNTFSEYYFPVGAAKNELYHNKYLIKSVHTSDNKPVHWLYSHTCVCVWVCGGGEGNAIFSLFV